MQRGDLRIFRVGFQKRGLRALKPPCYSTYEWPLPKLSAFVSAPLLSFCALERQVKNYLQLNLSLLYWILIAPFTGQFFKIGPIFRQMVAIGVRATPMVALTAFSVGVTLAMQAAHSLESLGAEMYIPDLVMLTLLREMGPVLIAVIVIGRSCSAVAAELGTMKVSEEIEALEVMAINPVQYLVVPRFLAMMVMLPALTILEITSVSWAAGQSAVSRSILIPPDTCCARWKAPIHGICIPE